MCSASQPSEKRLGAIGLSAWPLTLRPNGNGGAHNAKAKGIPLVASTADQFDHARRVRGERVVRFDVYPRRGA